MCYLVAECYHKWADKQSHCIATADAGPFIVRHLVTGRKLAGTMSLQLAGSVRLQVVQLEPLPVVGQVQVAAILAQ